MHKIAATDSVIGINYRYDAGRVITLPHTVVYSGPLRSCVEKAANSNVVVRSVVVPLAAIQRIDQLDAEYGLSKDASMQLAAFNNDAVRLSLSVGTWDETDQKALLRLALDTNK
jgi:hypothetical protein